MPTKANTDNVFTAFTPDAFMKAMPSAEAFGSMSKDMMSAGTESAKASVKGFQEANSLMMKQARERMSMTVDTGKSLAGARTFEEAMDIHQTFFKSALKSYVDGINELTSLYTSTMKEAYEPFAAQAKDVAEKAADKVKAA